MCFSAPWKCQEKESKSDWKQANNNFSLTSVALGTWVLFRGFLYSSREYILSHPRRLFIKRVFSNNVHPAILYVLLSTTKCAKQKLVSYIEIHDFPYSLRARNLWYPADAQHNNWESLHGIEQEYVFESYPSLWITPDKKGIMHLKIRKVRHERKSLKVEMCSNWKFTGLLLM